MTDRGNNTLVEKIGEEYIQQLKSGKNPQIEEFANRLPEHSDQIQNFIHALRIIDQCKGRSEKKT